jgi:hypothetical protein
VLDEELDGPLTHLWLVGGFSWHFSILKGASRIPGPIQTDAATDAVFGPG